MKETLHIFWADEYLGDLTHDTDGDVYRYTPKSDTPMQKTWLKITNADKSPERFRETLYDTRVFPKERINAREILHELGMLEYDPWVILRKGRFISDDLFWAHKDMVPEWFWKNHYLASEHPDYTKKTGKPMYSIVIPEDTSLG
jgi:hypothetical protein